MTSFSVVPVFSIYVMIGSPKGLGRGESEAHIITSNMSFIDCITVSPSNSACVFDVIIPNCLPLPFNFSSVSCMLSKSFIVLRYFCKCVLHSSKASSEYSAPAFFIMSSPGMPKAKVRSFVSHNLPCTSRNVSFHAFRSAYSLFTKVPSTSNIKCLYPIVLIESFFCGSLFAPVQGLFLFRVVFLYVFRTFAEQVCSPMG